MDFNSSSYTFTMGTHRGKDVIWVDFPFEQRLIEFLRKNATAYWSQTQKCWYTVDNPHYRDLFKLPQNSIGKNALVKIHPVNRPAFEQYLNLLHLKGYSPKTIKTYSVEFAQLLYVLKSHPVAELTVAQLKSYCLWCIKECKISNNGMHSRLNALKFYFEQALHKEKFFIDIPRPKKPSTLPKVLSMKDVACLFEVTTNMKHRLMLKLCYGMGLRVSEIVGLKIHHIDSKRMQVLIASGKGKKDRYVNLPQTILEELRAYYKQYRPKEYLFEGQYGGQYAIRSVQSVFKKALRKAHINKPVGIHSLRHSYATHLMECGTDITLIQKLLGHNQLKTTQIYTHVSKRTLGRVTSPLDRIQNSKKKQK